MTNGTADTMSGLGVTLITFSGQGPAPSYSCAQGSFAPGDTTDCTATYDAVPGDLGQPSIAEFVNARGFTSTSYIVSGSNTVTVTVAQPPTIAIDGGSAVPVPSPVTSLSGTSDASAGSPVSVRVGDGATVAVFPTTVQAGGSWAVAVAPPLGAGSYPVSAQVEDSATGLSTTVQQALTVQGRPPQPVITAPAPGAIVDDATPAIAGTGVPGDTLTVREGLLVVCTVPVGEDDDWSCLPAAPLAAGGHVVSATQTDGLGQTSDPSDPVGFTVGTPTPPPSPVVSAPVDGSTTATGTPTFSGHGMPGTGVEIADSVVPVCTTTVGTGTTWCCAPVAALPDGRHTIAVTDRDLVTELSSAPVVLTFTVDTTAPAPPVITSPTSGATVTTAQVAVAGTGKPAGTVSVQGSDGTELCTAPNSARRRSPTTAAGRARPARWRTAPTGWSR